MGSFFLQTGIRDAQSVLAEKTRLNTQLIEQKSSQAQESTLLAKAKERSQEMLKKVVVANGNLIFED